MTLQGGKQSTKINHPCISAHKAILMNGLKDGNGVMMMMAHFFCFSLVIFQEICVAENRRQKLSGLVIEKKS